MEDRAGCQWRAAHPVLFPAGAQWLFVKEPPLCVADGEASVNVKGDLLLLMVRKQNRTDD